MTSWFSDRILIGRVLAGIGGYLASHVVFASAEPVLGALAAVGVIVVLVALVSLAPANRMPGGLALAVAGFAAGIGTWFLPFAPFVLLSFLTVVLALVALVAIPAPSGSCRLRPRLVALGTVSAVCIVALGLASYEAWLVWPDAFFPNLPLERTYALLSDRELESVRAAATVWAWSTVAVFVVPLVLTFVVGAHFGVRRILTTTLGLTALAFFTLQIGTAALRWNLVEHGEFATDDYPWFAAIRTIQTLLFAAAFLIGAIRIPGELSPDASSTARRARCRAVRA